MAYFPNFSTSSWIVFLSLVSHFSLFLSFYSFFSLSIMSVTIPLYFCVYFSNQLIVTYSLYLLEFS